MKSLGARVRKLAWRGRDKLQEIAVRRVIFVLYLIAISYVGFWAFVRPVRGLFDAFAVLIGIVVIALLTALGIWTALIGPVPRKSRRRTQQPTPHQQPRP